MSTIQAEVGVFKSSDRAVITFLQSALNNNDGYIKVTLNSVKQDVRDVPSEGLPYNYLPSIVSPTGDQVPRLVIANKPKVGSWGTRNELVSNFCSKTSGTKPLTKKCFVFAVNDGKIDGNAEKMASSDGTTATTLNNLLEMILEKLPELPCDDNVLVTLDFTIVTSLA